jgi:hypothetical protein
VRTLATAAAVLALSLAACGSDDGDSSSAGDLGPKAEALTGESAEAVAAAEEYLVAYEEGDIDTICRLTSLGVDGDVDACLEDLRDFEGVEQPDYLLDRFALKGAAAEATLRPEETDGRPGLMRLRKVGGEWYVESATFL